MSFDFQKALDKRRASSPSRAYLWCVEMPVLDTHPANIKKSASFDAAVKSTKEDPQFVGELDTSLVNAVVTGITTPFFTFDTDKVTDGNSYWYKANHNSIATISINFEEQDNGIVWQYLNNWKVLIKSSNGGYNPPHFYKRDIKVHRLNPAKEIFQTFVYKNYFISEVSASSNDYLTNTPQQYSATFTGDSMADTMTVSGAELEQLMEEATRQLENIEIPYNRFSNPSVNIDQVAGVLTELSRRAF